MLSCKAAGTPAPEIKWFKDGVPLHNKSRFVIVQSGTLKIDGEINILFSWDFMQTQCNRGRSHYVTFFVLLLL